jgi:hypothetical protein
MAAKTRKNSKPEWVISLRFLALFFGQILNIYPPHL